MRRRPILLAAGIVVALGLVFVGMYELAAYKRRQQAAGGQGDAIRVAIDARACEPMQLTVPAGRATFEIENRIDRAVEWEILNGVIVVAERENIAPGFKQRLSARLQPGDYAITCGLLSNPRGALTVTATEASRQAAAAAPSLAELIGPLAEVQFMLGSTAGDLVDAVSALKAAITEGDLEKARSLYAPARLAYARLEPAADLFADLANKVDAQAAYLERREQDSGFTGFHRLEYGLFASRDLAGLEPVAAALQQDAQAIADRVPDLSITPATLTGGPAALLDKILNGRLEGTAEPYSHLDLVDLQGNLDTILKMAALLEPAITRTQPDLPQQIRQAGRDAQAVLDRHRAEDGTFASYTTVDAADRDALKRALTALAGGVGQLQSAIATD